MTTNTNVKLEVTINGSCYTKDYIINMKHVLISLSDDYMQLEDDFNRNAVFEIVTSRSNAETILALSKYDMWHAVIIK